MIKKSILSLLHNANQFDSIHFTFHWVSLPSVIFFLKLPSHRRSLAIIISPPAEEPITSIFISARRQATWSIFTNRTDGLKVLFFVTHLLPPKFLFYVRSFQEKRDHLFFFPLKELQTALQNRGDFWNVGEKKKEHKGGEWKKLFIFTIVSFRWKDCHPKWSLFFFYIFFPLSKVLKVFPHEKWIFASPLKLKNNSSIFHFFSPEIPISPRLQWTEVLVCHVSHLKHTFVSTCIVNAIRVKSKKINIFG